MGWNKNLLRDTEQLLSESAKDAEIEKLRTALEEVRTNGEWTEGEQRGDWKISPEVYALVCDTLPSDRK